MSKHAELIKQYCDDWLETDKPWERWEYKVMHHGVWCFPCSHLRFDVDTYYRRKPQTIKREIEYPKPEVSPPKMGQKYWFTRMSEPDAVDGFEWSDDAYDNNLLKHGQIHLTKEAAIQHAKALIGD